MEKTYQERLTEIEGKLDACLILLLKLTTEDGFTYNLMDKSPKWVRAMSVAERLASRVSVDVANLHPKCALGEMADLLTSLHQSDPFSHAKETAVGHTDGRVTNRLAAKPQIQVRLNVASSKNTTLIQTLIANPRKG